MCLIRKSFRKFELVVCLQEQGWVHCFIGIHMLLYVMGLPHRGRYILVKFAHFVYFTLLLLHDVSSTPLGFSISPE